MRDAILRWDPRPREQARDELAQWMTEIYRKQLRTRETELIKARRDPTQYRKMQDAGFELIEDSHFQDIRPSSGARMGPAPGPGPTSPSNGSPRA